MKEGFLLALRHHMELNHRQLRIWFFWPSIKCVISVAAAYVMQATWVSQSFADHGLVQLFYSQTMGKFDFPGNEEILS